MATSQDLQWFGDAVTSKMRQAQILGVNKTMGSAAARAKLNHAWQNRTGVLEGGIDITDYAAREESGVRGTWGVRDVVYARIHELGGIIKPKNGAALTIPQSDGSVRLVSQVKIPARPYLRPAADAEYPKLALNIRKAYERL
ncbi:phage morphogenesis protein [Maricaulis maris]|uniref:HK97 gp10 family phage protein n=1 Tax=Maricaulis maris TaxID=74318 RepID=A0A495DKZ2_9PROT|nr:phage morphogenesis protein [Maricaulis maris]RKR03575.1 hypothetical protein C7435_0011 [Maricaulis maris]